MRCSAARVSGAAFTAVNSRTFRCPLPRRRLNPLEASTACGAPFAQHPRLFLFSAARENARLAQLHASAATSQLNGTPVRPCCPAMAVEQPAAFAVGNRAAIHPSQMRNALIFNPNRAQNSGVSCVKLQRVDATRLNSTAHKVIRRVHEHATLATKGGNSRIFPRPWRHVAFAVLENRNPARARIDCRHSISHVRDSADFDPDRHRRRK